MPPFRKGLLKRKIINTTEANLNKDDSQDGNGSDRDDGLHPHEMNSEDTDSERGHDAEEASSSDGGESARDDISGVGSDRSSELTDSEADERPPTPRRAARRAALRRASPPRAAAEPAPVAPRDEYESGDTSDEEDRRNTVGDVPAWWYREYAHLGYDLDGRKLLRPPQRDHIDLFLRKCEDPEFWRTVRDPATGQDVVLSAEDLELVRRLREGVAPTEQADEPWLEWFSGEALATPLRAFPEHKRSFVPSREEARRVGRIVHALRAGWMKTRAQLAAERRGRRERRFYDLWGSGDGVARPAARHIPAPRRPPPAHAESYNPPPEYLLDADEMKRWESLAETPWKRKHTFLPRRHASLREVGAHERFVRERFLRCLDLYLAPRAIKMRLTLRPEELVPELPAPRDLRPFPASEALQFRGHAGLVRGVAFSPCGQHVVSGGDDGTVRVWEAATGRCLRTLVVGEPVAAVAWAPAGGLQLVAAAAGARLLLLSAGVGGERAAAAEELLRGPAPGAPAPDARTAAAVTWEEVTAERWERGERLAARHWRPLRALSWHARGDYVCATLAEGGARAVLVHQLSRRRSQLPLARAPGAVQLALFHPREPQLLVATQRSVHVYDLVKAERVRVLRAGVQWLSCGALHAGGGHLLLGSFDRRLVWFDLELSARPYRSLRLHGGAVRAVAFHPRYPLFASGGDDAELVVSHGAVYDDLLRSPLLVPLKRLAGGARRAGLCVLSLAWHPRRPWLLAACADGSLRLYS